MASRSLENIPIFLSLSERVGTAGQPHEDQFTVIRDAGYEVLINLRPLADALPNERALVENAAMAYISIPVMWEAPTVEDVEQFFAAMQANDGRRVFVHCALNMRVSAFMFLYRVARENVAPEQAALDLHRIWTPNPTWQTLIGEVLARYFCSDRRPDAENTVANLTTARLLLRDFEADDFEEVFAFRSDPNVMRYFTGKPETAEEVQDFLKRAVEYAQQRPQTKYRFAIVLRAENRVIGGCGLDITNAQAQEGEIGYHLLASCWGQGYATETARALLAFGFDHLHLHRVFADCFARNAASARVMEKAGMKYEARLRQNRRSAEGRDDTLMYSLLEPEWRAAALGETGTTGVGSKTVGSKTS